MMKPITATLISVIIENMIVMSIAAALNGEIKSAEYESKMTDQKTRLAEILETIKTS